LDKNTQVDVIYTDFSKAFDRIDHNILLNKLRHFGFSDSLLNLFESYLSDRFCYVNVLGFYSARLVVNSGVPQGSNLGPLLFLLFINDIVEIFSLNVLLLADDVKLYSTIRDISDCMRLQSNVDVLYGWCRSNGLPLNRDKCLHSLVLS
jgi:ribonuclease P/MRP protein subunit RPP40